ncbi:hypothetical protein P3S67_006811 [Capsicum chacoense]
MNGQPAGQPTTNSDRTVPEINNADNNFSRSNEDDRIANDLAHFQDAQDLYEDNDSEMSFDSIALHNLDT